MKLNLANDINKRSPLGPGLGIPFDRANQLYDLTREIMLHPDRKEGVGMLELMQRIADICDTLEEYTYCVLSMVYDVLISEDIDAEIKVQDARTDLN